MVASNFPINSDGSSNLSVGRSSMGIKSSLASAMMGLSSCTAFFSLMLSASGCCVSGFISGSSAGATVVSLSAVVSDLALRGRPRRLAAVDASAFSVLAAGSVVSSSAFGAVVVVATWMLTSLGAFSALLAFLVFSLLAVSSFLLVAGALSLIYIFLDRGRFFFL